MPKLIQKSGYFKPHAHKRSTNSYGEAFRINVEGSDPKYSFGYSNSSATTLYVFEAPIDLLSFLTLYPDGWQNQSYISLCGTSEHAMESVLPLVSATK